MSIDTAQRNRTPAGVSTGGQFTSKVRQEAPDGVLRVVKSETPAELAFYDVGGFEEGDFFCIDSVERSDEGAWTVSFREVGDQENDSYQATWSAQDGFNAPETFRTVNAEWHEWAQPGRNADDAFAQDLLDTDNDGAGDFFERVEAKWLENEPPF